MGKITDGIVLEFINKIIEKTELGAYSWIRSHTCKFDVVANMDDKIRICVRKDLVGGSTLVIVEYEFENNSCNSSFTDTALVMFILDEFGFVLFKSLYRNEVYYERIIDLFVLVVGSDKRAYEVMSSVIDG